MSVGKLWDPATGAWQPVNSPVSRIEFETLRDTAGVLNILASQPTLRSDGAVDVAQTVVDVSAYVPVGTKSIQISVRVTGVKLSNASFLTNAVYFKKNAADTGYSAYVVVELANAAASSVGIGITQTLLIPVTAARTFTYQKIDGIKSSSVGVVGLLGYTL